MGLDGGTKITRSDVLRGSSWRLANSDCSRSTRGGAVSTNGTYGVEKADPALVRRDRLNCCHLSGEDLQKPVVCDALGNLYCKASLLEFLLARDHGIFSSSEAEHRYLNINRKHSDGLQHIRNLKDVSKVCLHASNAPDDLSKSPTERREATRSEAPLASGQMASCQCPILKLPFLTNRVALISRCGHVFSYGVISMLGSDGENQKSKHCPLCDQAFKFSTDVIEVAADGERFSDQKKAVDKRLAKKRKASKLVGSLEAQPVERPTRRKHE